MPLKRGTPERLMKGHPVSLARGRHQRLAEAWVARGRTSPLLRGQSQAPWYPTLAIAFNEHRAVVREKRVPDKVLAADVADR